MRTRDRRFRIGACVVLGTAIAAGGCAHAARTVVVDAPARQSVWPGVCNQYSGPQCVRDYDPAACSALCRGTARDGEVIDGCRAATLGSSLAGIDQNSREVVICELH
jgi:hypothetical protein